MRPSDRRLIPLALLLAAVSASRRPARAPGAGLRRTASRPPRAAGARCLLRLPELTAEAGAPDGVVLGVVQADDMRDVGQMLVRAFYPELLQVGATFSPVELALLEPPVAWLNDSLAAYLAQSITKYIERRIGADRLEASSRSASVHTPRLRPGTTVGSSLALAAADAATGELLAFVELSVRPLDGRVPTDMLEDIEALLRVLLPAPGAQCAYLSNLCVARAARRRGIGSALVRASERVVGPAGWGHDALYLHVGMHDAPTSRLYRALGFEPLTQYDPQPWQVKWLGAAECTFYERRLEPAARAAISRGAAAGAEGQPPLGA